jgi:DNA-binding NtrC family response regulator
LRNADSSAAAGLEPPARDFFLTGSGSEVMRVLERTLVQIAPTDIPILLVGECGTGKAVAAQYIHQLSPRKRQPFVRAVCSALRADSVEAHFGQHPDKGADSRPEGTLFLKEIAELDSPSQRSLLYALPDGNTPTGSVVTGPRLISSTTSNLEEEVSAGRFRIELYYRMKGACLHLPPLRERKEDVPALAELLLAKHSLLQGRPRPHLSFEDISLLQEWPWPGNIRELENVIKNIVALRDAKSVLAELTATRPHTRPHSSIEKCQALKAATRAASRKIEQQLILDALAKTRWNRKRAAQELQISYKSLLSKLKQINEHRPDSTESSSAAALKAD